MKPSRPAVIAHRGASGYRPEHTIASYQLAIELGADFIEPDLVSTRDGVLVARHENAIGETTDVSAHPEFAERRVSKVIDGVRVTGWFTEDFTLAELKTLRARERLPRLRRGSAEHDGRYEIPTLQEILDLIRRCGGAVGVYPETKHPSYFDSLGLSLEEPLLEALETNGYRSRDDAVIIQSFEEGNLRELRARTSIRLMRLLMNREIHGLSEYADGIGPAKTLLDPEFVERAHAAGLFVHAWTFRSENAFLPPELRSGGGERDLGDYATEYERYFAMGVDGVFSDFPDHASANARSASDSLS